VSRASKDIKPACLEVSVLVVRVTILALLVGCALESCSCVEHSSSVEQGKAAQTLHVLVVKSSRVATLAESDGCIYLGLSLERRLTDTVVELDEFTFWILEYTNPNPNNPILPPPPHHS
jgi:hypothetical protein